jgi:hypothetical protein
METGSKNHIIEETAPLIQHNYDQRPDNGHTHTTTCSNLVETTQLTTQPGWKNDPIITPT